MLYQFPRDIQRILLAMLGSGDTSLEFDTWRSVYTDVRCASRALNVFAQSTQPLLYWALTRVMRFLGSTYGQSLCDDFQSHIDCYTSAVEEQLYFTNLLGDLLRRDPDSKVFFCSLDVGCCRVVNHYRWKLGLDASSPNSYRAGLLRTADKVKTGNGA